MLDMTAEGEKLYYITDDLDLYEYDPLSNTTEPLIEVLPGDTTTQPLIENEHFLMVAHVGDESQILIAVVVYDMEDNGETAKGVDLVELYTECFGSGWWWRRRSLGTRSCFF
ncbi:hypothetical protein QJS10_CPA09g01696 [Acorus calamus]|uniref:Uncharacterized protein n=1 Tax=Acorus calamus TaxID=4465 RepID=A0AAV9E3B2_ACOCL|nr:hypothetical protein QJS10_CPA09g01696 [Acorus calamus]